MGAFNNPNATPTRVLGPLYVNLTGGLGVKISLRVDNQHNAHNCLSGE